MVRYDLICATKRAVFEEAARRYLTLQKPNFKPKRAGSASSDEDSAAIDPGEGHLSFSAIGVGHLINDFRHEKVEAVRINYRAKTGCVATANVVYKDEARKYVTYFPRMQAAVEMGVWCTVEEIIQEMCQRCNIPFQVVDDYKLSAIFQLE